MFEAWARAGLRVAYGVFAAALIGFIASPIVDEWNAPNARPTEWVRTAATPENIALAVIIGVCLGLIARAATEGGGGR
jgi:hypothetical protein